MPQSNSDLESVTIEYQEDGKQLVKVLDKRILSKGTWATIAFLFQEWDNSAEEFKPPKVRLVRYKKTNGRYLPQGKFNISGLDQALKIASVLQEWFKEQSKDK